MSKAYLILCNCDSYDGTAETTPVSLWSNYQVALGELANLALEFGLPHDGGREIFLPTDGTGWDSVYYYIEDMELN